MTRFLASGFASAMALTVSLGAQTPASQTPAAMSHDHEGGMVTVEGCLMKETEVPGRRVPEEARTRQAAVADEDYVLTDTKMIKGMAPAPSGKADKNKDKAMGTAGTMAAPLMYKVKGDGLKFSDNAGKRVQIDGMFDHESRADNPVAYAFDLVKLKGTAIRQVAGDCPKK